MCYKIELNRKEQNRIEFYQNNKKKLIQIQFLWKVFGHGATNSPFTYLQNH